MTKEELVTEICGRTGLKKDVVLATVETAMDVVKETMAAGENVYLRGFGSFTLKERAAKLTPNIIADMIAEKILLCTKEVLTSDEVAKYMGISKSSLYKLTMNGEIPHYKPNGKMCYFNRAELEQWLQQNRCATATEIKDRANRYIMKGGKYDHL